VSDLEVEAASGLRTLDEDFALRVTSPDAELAQLGYRIRAFQFHQALSKPANHLISGELQVRLADVVKDTGLAEPRDVSSDGTLTRFPPFRWLGGTRSL
jgi:hypothetical protein